MGLVYLHGAIKNALLPNEFAEWTMNGGPRGPKRYARFLLPIASAALWAAEQMLTQAQANEKLQGKIDQAFLDNTPEHRHLRDRLRSYADSPRQVAIMLADRSLGPAWQRFGVKPLLTRRMRDVYRELLPVTERNELAFQLRRPKDLDTWFDILLGPQGQAAVEFDLLR